MKRRLTLLAVVIVSAAACQRGTASPPTESGPSSVSAPVRRLSFEGAIGARGDAGPSGTHWRRAETLEPHDLALLAAEEGALGLLLVVRRGGGLGRLALLAFPAAPDARLYLGPLCELLGGVEPADRVLVVDAIGRVLSETSAGSRVEVGQCMARLSAIRPPHGPREHDAIALALTYL